MTKANLVKKVAEVVGPGVTKRECGLMVDGFLDAVKDALAQGNGIELRGFGAFKVWHRKARTVRNPRTGTPVEVPCRDAPVFEPSRQPAQPGGSQLGGAWEGNPVGRSSARHSVAAGLSHATVAKPADAVLNTAAWQGEAPLPLDP